MSIAYFDSLDNCDVVEVELIAPNGNALPVRLLVDSGFTGASSFVLSDDLHGFALVRLASGHAAGALAGRQKRVLVRCTIPDISFHRDLAAIIAETRSLSLPAGVVGMVGLTFLRQFRRWGAERGPDEKWRFFLTTDSVTA